MTLTPRPGILDISPYVGGDSTADGHDRVIRLASNENPLGPGPRVAAAFAAVREELHRYPDGAAAALRAAIGEAEGLDPARIVCGAGSDELISLLVRAYAGPGDEVLHSAHGFLMYALAAKAAGAAPIAVPERDLTADVDAIIARAGAKTRLVFLANPNNPTGSYLDGAALRRLRVGLPDHVLLVIDAAYAEYVTVDDYESGAALVDEFDNVAMTRTFSKIYGLAALRLGWAYCPAAVADVLNRVRGPFNVCQPALAAGVAALGDRAHAELSRRHNARWRDWLAEQMTDMGLHVYPSVGNFLMVRFPAEDSRAAPAAVSFLKENGILVRGMAGYGLPECVRITIGNEAETRDVAAALARFMAGPDAGMRA
jgi:histidinol-phosphate aminotransferase